MMSIVIVAMDSFVQSRSFLDFFGPVRIFGKSRLHWLHHVASSASLRRGGATPQLWGTAMNLGWQCSYCFCQCLHFFLGPTNPRGHNSMLFIGAAILCPSLGLGKASAQGQCVTGISFSQLCLLFFLNINQFYERERTEFLPKVANVSRFPT